MNLLSQLSLLVPVEVSYGSLSATITTARAGRGIDRRRGILVSRRQAVSLHRGCHGLRSFFMTRRWIMMVKNVVFWGLDVTIRGSVCDDQERKRAARYRYRKFPFLINTSQEYLAVNHQLHYQAATELTNSLSTVIQCSAQTWRSSEAQTRFSKTANTNRSRMIL